MGASKCLGVLGVVTVATASMWVAPDIADAASPEVFDDVGSAGFVVPADVCEITVDAIGAEGGGVTGDGGLGGEAVATVPVTPGESLQVRVGGRGGNPVLQTGGT